MVKMVWDTDSGEPRDRWRASIAKAQCCRTRRIAYASAPRWVTRRRLQLFAYAALAVNQSQQLLLEADIRFRAHQYLQMLAIVGNVLADALNNMLDAGRIWLGE